MRRRHPEAAQPYHPPEREPSFGQRLRRFLTFIGAVFAIAMAVIVTQRLSQDSLALLIGLSCGVLTMLPTLALGLFIWRREDARRQEEAAAQRPGPAPASPPVIVVTPQAMPGYGQRSSLPHSDDAWLPAGGERVFEIVGGDD